MSNKIMTVDIAWTHYTSKELGVSGHFMGAAGFTAFTIDEVVPGTYRLTRHLPRPMFRTWSRETFHTSMEDAKDAAQEAGVTFFKSIGHVVAAHPVIRNMDKVTQLVFPAQLCDEKCEFYGGQSVHEDITVEKAIVEDPSAGEWTIARADGTLYRNPSQSWEIPAELVVDGQACSWLTGFLWPLEEALEQVHFMHCG